MSEWKVGDKALCINIGILNHQSDSSLKNLPPLRLNAKYVVNEIHVCSCGSISLDVGLFVNTEIHSGRVRCECGAQSAPSDIHWCSAKRFVKEVTDKAESENIEEQIKEAIESGNQELVDLLLDKYNK